MDHSHPRKQCILLVEDNEVIRSIFESMLQNMGCAVITAENGEDGLAAFGRHRHRINAIITDLKMPVMNGITMIDRIRQIDEDVPIAIVTAYDHAGRRGIEKRLNVRHFNKPADVEELVSFLLGEHVAQ